MPTLSRIFGREAGPQSWINWTCDRCGQRNSRYVAVERAVSCSQCGESLYFTKRAAKGYTFRSRVRRHARTD